MGNCLKTQLKESVNNPNLPVYNKIRVAFVPSNSVSGYLKSTEAANVIVENATVDTFSLPANEQVVFVFTAIDATKSIVIYVPKYSLDVFYCNSVIDTLDINDLQYCNVLTRVNVEGIPAAQNERITGDLSVFNGKNLTAFKISQSKSITGDIKNLSSCVSINSSGFALVSCNGVTGTIESLIEGLMSNDQGHEPMTSGTFVINVKFGPNVTLNGNRDVTSIVNIDVSIADGVATLKNASSSATVATYTEATNTWTYAE